MKLRTALGFVAVTLLVLFAINVNANEELANSVGDYALIEHHCPGGIADGINVGIYNGVGIVKTSLGYLFSINLAGGSVIIKNGPITICTGSINGDKFSGSCMDNNRDFCSVIYQKVSR